MKLITKEQNFYLLRFDKGDEVTQMLATFCQTNNIYAASFQAIGAAGTLILSYYNLKNKQYEDKDITEDVEIVSMLGNVAVMDDEIIIHSHGVFGRRDFSTVAGHIKKLIVSATCEVSLTTHEGKMTRTFDEETGLNLLT